MFDEIVKNLLLYIPISLIGVWRWSYWLIRRIAASMYRPKVEAEWPPHLPRPTVTVITPVYNEDPATFEAAMQSFIKNGVDEIIAVIDKSNTRHIVDYERRYASNKQLKTKCRMIVTPKSGKRAALCDGIEHAKGDLIVLVDSDTIWSDDVLKKTLPYFVDSQIGGATLTQRIHNPKSTADVMFDIQLWTRYRDEVPFLLGVGRVFNTLSGRTAFYRREALLNPQYDNIHKLRHEHFLGTRGISGDDKRLTHLILEQGWHTAYVLGPSVLTPGLSSTRKFLKQRLRWTRNSWRADLRALMRGWVWKHPALAIFMLDHFIQPFVMLIGPVVFTIAIINREWFFAGILIAWWLVSRFVRLFAYFKAHPARLIYLPAYIIYGYITAIIKIYAFATLIENSWATRWHATRAKRKKLMRRVLTVGSGVAALLLFFVGLGQFVMYARAESGADINPQIGVNSALYVSDSLNFTTDAPTLPKLPDGSVLPTGVQRYIVQPGDTLSALSERFGMDVQQIKKLNGLQSANKISVGQELLYYQVR